MLRFTELQDAHLVESTWSAGWLFGLGVVVYGLIAWGRIKTDERLDAKWAGRLVLAASVAAIFGGWAVERLVWGLPFVEVFGAPTFALGWTLIVGAIVGMRFTRLFDIDTAQIGDALVPAVLFGAAVARLGCVIQGCDFGTVTTGEWALRYPPGTDAFRWAADNGLLEELATSGPRSHPFALYQSIAFASMGVVLTIFPRDLVRPGLISSLAAIGIGITVAVTEIFHAGKMVIAIGSVSIPIMAPLAVAGTIAAFAALARVLQSAPEEDPPPASDSPFVT